MLKQTFICSTALIVMLSLSGCEKKETQITIERGSAAPIEAVKNIHKPSPHSSSHSGINGPAVIDENRPDMIVPPPAGSNTIVNDPATPIVQHHKMMAPLHRGEEIQVYNRNHE